MKRLVLVCAALAACGGPPPAAEPERPYPCTLHDPRELAPDIVIEQHVEATKDGHGGGFDAVVQKNGDELLVVGLGPVGVRAFTIRQHGAEITFEQRLGPKPPFPPRNVLVDVHRAFFKRLPGEGSPEGTRTGHLDDEDVVETWRGGELVERTFARPTERGVVRVLYGPGCQPMKCEPSSVRVVNEWFGYELRIENRRFQRLSVAQ